MTSEFSRNHRYDYCITFVQLNLTKCELLMSILIQISCTIAASQ